MIPEVMLEDITARLYSKNIQDLRQIARVVGVNRPANGKKDEIISSVMAIAKGNRSPAPRSSRGAPPKKREYDTKLVTDIENCREYYLAVRRGERLTFDGDGVSVSDGISGISEFSGILERCEKHWYVRVKGCLFSGNDVSVQDSFISRFSLREGDFIEGEADRSREDQSYGLTGVTAVNGSGPDTVVKSCDFSSLVCDYPKKKLSVSCGKDDLAGRMVDLLTPLGAGQRAVITGGSRSGKTQLLKAIATGICANYREILTIALLLGARPEEVTEFKCVIPPANVYSTGFGDSAFTNIHAATLIAKYAKRRVELGAEVVLIVDGLEKLALGDGGAEDGAEINKILALSGNFNERGSLTVVGALNTDLNAARLQSAVSAANMRIALSEDVAAQRIFPAFDLRRCFSAKPELLLTKEELAAATALRAKAAGTDGLCAVRSEFITTDGNGQIAEKYKD